MNGRLLLTFAVALVVSTAGCGGDGETPEVAMLDASCLLPSTVASGPSAPALPRGDTPVPIDPAQFTTRIDNPYFPLAPGNRWVYREGDERIEVTVTDQTKRVAMGVEVRVVHDLVTEDGNTIEDTFDWYAQDRSGNVWYFGEDTKEYENGRMVSTKGSWEAGVAGAQPGIIMPAQPAVGMAYRQEYLRGEAEDAAHVLALGERVTVPAGTFTDTVRTADYTPLEPALCENKTYARGVGTVLTVQLSGGSGSGELIEYTVRP
jgi:hypothetical protein